MAVGPPWEPAIAGQAIQMTQQPFPASKVDQFLYHSGYRNKT